MKKILIIDDDEEMCVELEEILKREGFHVETVFDGLQGYRRIEEGRYDLVVLDLKLPKLNGYQVLKSAKESKPQLKVLVLSGRPLGTPLLSQDGSYNEEEDRVLSVADGVMNKPFAVAVFLLHIRKLIEK